uniref:Uncharacterized protein n=1 Tax=Podoviridae sp. ct9A73 TaxID=2825225 RepID=A0A8S5UJR4_9CAUD|nr:MAG TPA: hypothetical protein [Podoviridae sp. ct9A73]
MLVCFEQPACTSNNSTDSNHNQESFVVFFIGSRLAATSERSERVSVMLLIYVFYIYTYAPVRIPLRTRAYTKPRNGRLENLPKTSCFCLSYELQ